MRNNTKYFVSLLCLLGVMHLSCKKDWLDEKANKQQAIPSTMKDLQAILNSELLLNNDYSATLGELASDGHYVTESAWLSSNNNRIRNAYTWSNNAPYDDANWTDQYNRIFACNVVLDAINTYKTNNNESQSELDDVKGQALFHRADAFYRLAQIWAPPFSPSTSNSDLGVPLRLEADVTIPSVRSTVKQTYDQIINDLHESAKSLSATHFVKTRPYKTSAYALLARVYLSMREYDKARVFADSCLQRNNTLINYNDLPTTTNFIGDAKNNPEIVFYIRIQAGGISNFLTSACFIDTSLYNQYDDNDLRRVIFFKQNSNGHISFKGTYGVSASNLFGGLANDELYLIRAEGFARIGEVDLAMADLNTLLRSRWRIIDGRSTYFDQTASNADDALKRILTERKKELLLRGLRWTDLRRLNFENAFKETITRSIGGNTFVLDPGSFRYTFPIPNEILARSSMQQNTGW